MNLGWLKAAQTSIENSLHPKPRNVNNSQLVERVKERSSCCECFPGQMDDVLDRVCAFHVRRNYHRCFPKLVSNCRRRTLFTCTFNGIKLSYIYLQQEIRLESSITRVWCSCLISGFRFTMKSKLSWSSGCCRRRRRVQAFCIGNLFILCWVAGNK